MINHIICSALSCILLGLAALAPTAGARAAPHPARPNVLVFFTDDQRYDTIAALANPNVRTPTLDRLVADGTTFTRAYIMGAMQGAVCVPSRAMLMSGRTLFHVKENLAGQTTWPEQFSRAGYRTFITGKWHNQPASALRAFSEGKAVFLGGMSDPYHAAVQDISPEHKFVNLRTNSEHSVKQFADAAIEFLRGGQKGPFLCYVAFNGPHDPRVAPTNFHAPYNASLPPAPPNFMPEHPLNSGDLDVRDELLAPWPRTQAVVRKHLADYYSYVSFIDSEIGRVLGALKQSGRDTNTLVVFSSDNGLAIGSHGLFGKQNVYEHSVHQPLIFCGPGIPKGKRSEAFCYLLDVFPTLGELCGVAQPDGNEGISLAPVLQGKALRGRESIFTAYRSFQRAVRDDRWKLIVYPRINQRRLLDLIRDPYETNDLSQLPESSQEVQRLTALLSKWQKDLGDTQPLTTDRPDPVTFDYSKAESRRRAMSR